jgi:transcriptional regulator with PAS, ATPase and Fis domain
MMHGSKSAFRAQRSADHDSPELLGLVGAVERWPDLAQRAAQSSCTILITGETGVGKGRLALWLHANSPRADATLIPVNCGAIPETVIDSQLFGHVRGAFTGAHADHPGFVRAAEHGTLFLDEVSELPASAQTRLLRLLQEREVQPVGCARPIHVDVRVIAATNRELHELVGSQKFRQDLLFRLDVIQLRVKPLRDRPQDLPVLIDAFTREFAELYDRPNLVFDRGAVNVMRAFHWPGNIRQLRTVIERLYVLLPDERVSVSRLLEVGQIGDSLGEAVPVSMTRVRRETVHRVLAEAGGSITRAASAFGVHRSTIYRWLNRTK